MKNVDVGKQTQPYGYCKDGKSHKQGTALGLFHLLHIYLQAGKEHYIIEPHFAKQFETGIALKHIEPVGPNEQTRQNHSNDVRHTQLIEDKRRKQHNAQHTQKNPGGLGNGERKEMKHFPFNKRMLFF